MKKIVLLLVAASLIGLALYFGLSGGGSTVAPLELPQPATSGNSEQPPSPLQGAIPQPPAAEATAEATASAGQRAVVNQQPGALLPADRRCTLLVHVALPAGAPADDSAELIVHSRGASDADELARELVALKPTDPMPAWLLARSSIPGSGDTEIVLERGTTPVQLTLLARYSYAPGLVAVDVSSERVEQRLKAQLGAWVSGRLIVPADADEAQRDCSDIEVELRSDPMAGVGGPAGFDMAKVLARQTKCSGDGAFELRGVPVASALTLTGRPEHLAAFKSLVAETRAGQHLEVTVALVHGAVLAGKVVGESGEPIAGAKLEVRADAVMFGMGGRVVRKGKTEADGSFQLDAVASGKVMLDVKGVGYLDLTQTFELVEGQNQSELVLRLERGASLGGRVAWSDGRPAADIQVDVSFDRAFMMGMGALNAARGGSGEGKTDAAGAFTVTGLGKGPFTVEVRGKPGDGDDTLEWSASLDGVKPGTLDLVLTLQPASSIAGRVVDDTGAPVAECTIAVARKSTNAFIPGESKSEKTLKDPEGRFSLENIEPGPHTLTAKRESGVSSEALDVTLPLAAGAAELVLTLPRPASISGRVLLPGGAPAAGAKVAPQWNLAAMQSGRAPNFTATVETKEDGSFTLESLPMGSVSLQATKDGFAPSEGSALSVTPALVVADIVLTLRTGGTITGEVYAKDGKAEAGANILAQMPDLRYGQNWSKSDGAGKFEFTHMPPGQWQVMVLPSTQSADSGSGDDAGAAMSQMMDQLRLSMADVKDGETVHVVLGAPPKDPVHVNGHVSSDGAPVVGAMVSFMSNDGGSANKAMNSLKLRSTDKDGRFQLDLEHAGGYLVSVQQVSTTGAQQSVEFSRQVPEVANLDLELELPIGAISGRVLGVDGNPLAGARISLGVDGPVRAATITGGRFSEIVTDERGEYVLDWLSPGRYSVAAGGTLFGAMLGDKSVPARQVHDGIEVGAGQRVSGVDFRLGAGCELQGKVLDGAGKPVADAGIFVRDEQGRAVERISMNASDGNGEFHVRGLGIGRYTISARSADLVSLAEASVELREGEVGKVDLRMGAGTILLVTVTGKSDALLEASFSVVDENGRQVNGLYSMGDLMRMFSGGGFDSKQQRVGPLAPGKYKVTAFGPDGSKTTKPVILNGQPERKLTLKLDD